MPEPVDLMRLASPAIGPAWDRDAILPFARRVGGAPAQQDPPQWQTGADVMRALDARQGNQWQFAIPQVGMDIAETVHRVGSAPWLGPMVTHQTDPEQINSMIDAAGSVVGPMAAHGFVRNALAPTGSHVGVFGGRLSKTANHTNLAEAEALAAFGAPREEIWSKTGWFQGADKKWRFEIDDSQSLLKQSDPYVGPIGGNFEHPGLFTAYPDLEHMHAKTHGAADFRDGAHIRPSEAPIGPARPESIEMIDTTPGSARNGILHELNHAIQEREGFATGGNPGQFSRYTGGWLLPELADMWQARSKYNRLAGEVESRAVETRSNMTPEQRSNRPPWLDYDVPDHKQIVQFRSNNGDMGTSHLDRGYRGQGSDTRNYGVLDDSIKDFLRKYSLYDLMAGGSVASRPPNQ